ncbi:hypothetical protein [Kitasatospora sp. NBC_01266]|uniref:hypothetical protein n=1 Tax=Kitasatospora sp. NBC_01266 TaxID=2903572 RepID=UPI002E37E6ED|nr:hypothetical protein [Kitasatospora sp. NBC_01266]
MHTITTRARTMRAAGVLVAAGLALGATGATAAQAATVARTVPGVIVGQPYNPGVPGTVPEIPVTPGVPLQPVTPGTVPAIPSTGSPLQPTIPGTVPRTPTTGVPASGGASPTSYLELCSHGTYTSYVIINKATTADVAPHKCSWFPLYGHGTAHVAIHGSSGGRDFLVGTDSFDISQGERIETLNSPGNNDWDTM